VFREVVFREAWVGEACPRECGVANRKANAEAITAAPATQVRDLMANFTARPNRR
jgi:hypothetical protein